MSSIDKSPSAPATAYSQAAMVEVVGSATPVPGIDGVSQPAAAHEYEKINIPDDFLKLGCLACSCGNTTWPGCFGCKSSGTCLCFEGYVTQCKILEGNPDVCCMCIGANMECVVPRTCCQTYKQVFCWECFMSLPPVDTGFRAAPVKVLDIPGSAILDNVTICDAEFCYIRSFNCDMPYCILDGCYKKEECICLKSEFISARWMCWDQAKPNPDTLCILSKGQYLVQYPKTCCKGISHEPCFDCRYAFPCDDDVPCVYTFLPCCVCCTNCTFSGGCCVTIEDVKYKVANNGVRRPPGAQTAQPGAPGQRV